VARPPRSGVPHFAADGQPKVGLPRYQSIASDSLETARTLPPTRRQPAVDMLQPVMAPQKGEENRPPMSANV